MSKGYLRTLSSGKLGATLNYQEYSDLCYMAFHALETYQASSMHEHLVREVITELVSRLMKDTHCPLLGRHYKREKNPVKLTPGECIALFIACNPAEPIGFCRLILNEIHRKLT